MISWNQLLQTVLKDVVNLSASEMLRLDTIDHCDSALLHIFIHEKRSFILNCVQTPLPDFPLFTRLAHPLGLRRSVLHGFKLWPFFEKKMFFVVMQSVFCHFWSSVGLRVMWRCFFFLTQKINLTWRKVAKLCVWRNLIYTFPKWHFKYIWVKLNVLSFFLLLKLLLF